MSQVSHWPPSVTTSISTIVTQGTVPWIDKVAYFGGNAVVTGVGASGLGIPRVTVSNDSNILATQSGVWTTGRTWVLDSSTDSVAVSNFPSSISVTQGTSPWVISGTVTANQGTSPWLTSRNWDLNFATDQVDASGSSISVSNFPAIQPVSQSGVWSVGRTWTLSSGTDSVNVGNFPGSFSVTQGTSPWVDNITQFGSNPVVTGTGASGLGIPRVTVSNDSNILATQSGTWTTGRTWTLAFASDKVDASGSSVSISNFPATVAVTQSTSPWVVSGTVTANQGGAPWSENLTQVGGSAITLGQKTSANSIPVVIASDQSAVPVTGTVTANIGTTNGLALDTTLTTLSNRFTSTTSAVTRVSASASSVQLLASTAGRKAAYLYNESVSFAYVKLGTTASVTSYTLLMYPFTFAVINNDPVYTGKIDAIWTTASGAMQVTELT